MFANLAAKNALKKVKPLSRQSLSDKGQSNLEINQIMRQTGHQLTAQLCNYSLLCHYNFISPHE